MALPPRVPEAQARGRDAPAAGPYSTHPLDGHAAADRKKALQAFNVATGNYRVYDKNRKSRHEIIGVNNLGEITFDWGDGDDKRVNHTLRWHFNVIFETVLPVFTTYTVSLNPSDPAVRP